MEKLKVGIIGATGMVGQRFILLLSEHPYFEISALVAGPRSAGRSYTEAVEGRWKMTVDIPERVRDTLYLYRLFRKGKRELFIGEIHNRFYPLEITAAQGHDNAPRKRRAVCIFKNFLI